MIEWGQNIVDGKVRSAQVCIIGSGPAGITLAWYLLKEGIDVILIDGSRDVAALGQKNENVLLYNGKATGQFVNNEPEFLILPTSDSSPNPPWERERVYGGTSTHWGGQSRPLDPVTFEATPALPGWPITRSDLDPFYEEACSFMQLYGDYYGPDGAAGYNFTAEFWAKELDQQVAQLDGFDVDMYQFPLGSLLQFQQRTVDGKTIGESDARVIRNASLLQIVHQGGNVSELEVGSLTDGNDPTCATRFRIKADVFVLACGAVANARQLLLSEAGNDLVGRFFTGHPFANGLNAVSVSPDSYLNPQEQRMFSYQQVDQSKYGISSVVGKFTPTAEVVKGLGVGRCWFDAGGGHMYHELLPDLCSRITLADDDPDVFGQPRTSINWKLADASKLNYAKLVALFATSVIKKGGQVLGTASWEDFFPKLVLNGHHLGTTRMSEDGCGGVVDKDLKVHGMGNLFVAGSSVWASPGISNPTFSIITFSIRLADHIAAGLGSKAAS